VSSWPGPESVKLCVEGQIAPAVLAACCVDQGKQLGVETASARVATTAWVATTTGVGCCETRKMAQADSAAAGAWLSAVGD
jgi:hypothetical protein